MDGMPRRRRRLMAEINVVPYIDVMLVLLIIFMITAPLLTQGIQLDLPAVGAEPLDAEMLERHEPLVLSIDADGRLYLNIGGDEETPLADDVVLARASAVMRREPETPVLVRADQAVTHGRVVAGMRLLQEAGAGRVGIVTGPLETDR
ncbi:MAG: protein TolR [Gammaproteobacteria bacterium]|nr:protein TolR [Gammaproteobacteria bacterium]TVQ45270.1 MAG: protein TolR [Gammaproteobacteria bacterium]